MQATLPRAERVGKGGRARTAPQPNARITSSPKRPSTFQFRDHGHPRSRRGGSPGRVLQRKPVGRPKVIKGTVPSVPSRLGNRTLPACPHVRAARRDHQPAGRPGAAGGSAGRMVGVVCAGMVAHRPRGEAVQGAPIGPAFQTRAACENQADRGRTRCDVLYGRAESEISRFFLLCSIAGREIRAALDTSRTFRTVW
jgi:hypothetical protein